MMHILTQDLIRASIALSVGALEWDSEEITHIHAIYALRESLTKITKIIKQIEKEF